MQPKQQLFNCDKFVERLFGDETLAQQIGYSVLRDFEYNLEGLKEALDRQDESQVLFFLHSIKGVAANAHCDALFKLSRELEQEGKAGNMAECLAGMGKLITLSKESTEALQAYLDTA